MVYVDEILKSWSSEQEYQGRKIDELFNIEGVPLWWFFKRLFASTVVPSQINGLRIFEKEREINAFEKIKFDLNVNLTKKLLLLNEKRKIKFFRHQRKAVKDKERKILFLSYSNHIKGNEIYRIQEMVDKIRKDKKIKEFILFVDTLTSSNYKRISGKDTIYDYYDPEISQEAKTLSKELSSRWKNIDEESKIKFFSKGDISLWPYIKYSFNFYWSEEFLYLIILYFKISRKLIEYQNIKAVVLTGRSMPFETCLAAAAYLSDAPVFVIQHGFGLGIRELTFPMKHIMFSDFNKQALLNENIPEEDIFISGPIIFDGIEKYINLSKDNLKSGNPKKKVLIATGPFIEESYLSKKGYFARFETMINGLKDIPNLSITIKLHPREKHKDLYEKLMKKSGYENAEVIRDINKEQFYNLIKECDVFVNFGSTTAIEAIIIGKPVVTINICELRDKLLRIKYPRILEKENMSRFARYNQGCLEAVKESLNNPQEFREKREKFLRKYCARIDGKAHDRAVEYIYSLTH